MKITTFNLFVFLFSYSFAFAQTNDSLSNEGLIKIDFNGQLVEAKLICTAVPITVDEADANDVLSIKNTLMAAQKAAQKEVQLLDVNLIFSTLKIQDRFLAFSIENPTERNLTIEIFDENYLQVLSCSFSIKSGLSFNVIDIKILKKGTYHLYLRDEERLELNRHLSIKKNIKVTNPIH